ncbi:hypothetical protein ABPG74_007087 [Tetrahymena malaccensis]
MDNKGPNIQMDEESEYEMYERFFFLVAAILVLLIPVYFCRSEQDEYKKLKRESNRLKREEKQKRKQEKRSRTSLQSEESNSTENSNSFNSIIKETNETEWFSKEN